ncbi:methyl-accepting chemotaxis protein, partial [Helicobacter muridarum]
MPQSITTKLTLIVCAIVVFIMIIIGLFDMYRGKNSALNKVIEFQGAQLADVDLILRSFNNNSLRILKGLARGIESIPSENMDSKENIISNIGNILKYTKVLTSVHASVFGFSNGMVVFANNKVFSSGNDYEVLGGNDDSDYNASTRDWYIGAANGNKPFQTGVYADFVDKIPSMTYSIPIVIGGKFIGVAGVDVLLSTLQGYFDEIGKSGSNIFVLDSKGIPFVATDASIIMKEAPIYKEIVRISAQTGDFEEFFINDGGLNKIGQCKTSTDSNFAVYTLCSLNSIDDIEGPIVRAGYLQLAISIIASLVISAIIYLAVKYYLRPINSVLSGLIDLFAFLNYEKKDVTLISVKSQDELGRMAEAINSNIQRTQKSLEQDSNAVAQSVQTAKAIEQGDLSARIMENPANPQLKELKNVLNSMLDVLQQKIGRDTNEIARVFDSYTRLDFTTKINDAKGQVEIVTNTLGNEITKMLHTSANFAKELESQSKELENAVNTLSESSNKQASS